MARRHFESADNDGHSEGSLTRALSEPHYPLGHVLLNSRRAIEPLGIHDPLGQRLGAGSFGTAYEVGLLGKSVLKFTRDHTEAQASALLCNHSSRYIVDIYQTWSLDWTHEKHLGGWYAVHRAYLNPLSKKDAKLMKVIWQLYDDDGLDLKLPRPTHRAMIDKWKSYVREELEGRGMYTQPNVIRAMQLLNETGVCVRALHKLGVDWEDIHPDNMMRRDDGTMAIGDVGYGLMHDDGDIDIQNLTEEVARAYLRQLSASA